MTLESNNNSSSSATDFDATLLEKYLVDICDNLHEFQLVNFKIEKEIFTKIIAFLEKRVEKSKRNDLDPNLLVQIPIKKLAFRKYKESGAVVYNKHTKFIYFIKNNNIYYRNLDLD